MSGLFGAVRIRAGAADPAATAGLRDAIGRALTRLPTHRTETYDDPNGRFSLGRTGVAHGCDARWPIKTGTGQIFVVGRPEQDAEGLQGFYAAFHAPLRGTLSVESDRTGSHRVYWTEIAGHLVLAPEVKALLAVGAPREPDPAAFGTFLASGMLYRDQTLISSVRRLCGGQALTITDGRVCVDERWRYLPGSAALPVFRRDEAAKELAHHIRSSCRRHAQGATGLTVFLSGGADSRAILAATLAAGAEPFTATWADRDAVPDGDVAVARRIAETLGLRDHMTMLRDLDAYETEFEAMNAFLDGACEMAAEHPAEFDVMRRIAARGTARVFRGDEAFGWRQETFTLEQSWREIGLRRLRDATQARELLTPEHRGRVVEASETVFERIEARYGDLPPNQAKDALYFDVRMHGYLQGSAQWRQMIFDERNPLIDDPILDFMKGVPEAPRLWKGLFMDAVGHLTEKWPRISYASASDLAPWNKLLRPEAAAGAYMRRRLGEPGDAFWRLIDQRRALDLLAPYERADACRTSRTKAFGRRAKGVLVDLHPRLAARIETRVKRASVPHEALARRVLILKDWHDRFIAI